MKKLFIPSLFAVAFAATVNATDATPVVTEVAPVAEVTVAPAVEVKKEVEAVKAEVKSYFACAKNLAHSFVGQYVEAHPYYAMAATAVVTVLAVKAFDFATSSDEEDEF